MRGARGLGVAARARSAALPRAMLAFVALAPATTSGCDDRPRARIETEEGVVVLEVAVDVARSEGERRRGLRGRQALAPDEGLWIAFPGEDEICLVNDGVPFGVDAILLRARVVSEVLLLDADDPTPRCGRASEVLEVGAGRAREVRAGHLGHLE